MRLTSEYEIIKKEHNLRTSDLYIEYDVVNSFIEKNTDDFVTQIEVEIIQ